MVASSHPLSPERGDEELGVQVLGGSAKRHRHPAINNDSDELPKWCIDLSDLPWVMCDNTVSQALLELLRKPSLHSRMSDETLSLQRPHYSTHHTYLSSHIQGGTISSLGSQLISTAYMPQHIQKANIWANCVKPRDQNETNKWKRRDLTQTTPRLRRENDKVVSWCHLW